MIAKFSNMEVSGDMDKSNLHEVMGAQTWLEWCQERRVWEKWTKYRQEFEVTLLQWRAEKWLVAGKES